MNIQIVPILVLVLLTGLSTQSVAQNDGEIILPELGDSVSSLISLQQEKRLGQAWLKVFRSQVKTINDPLLQDYLEELTYKLATYSELKDRQLNIVIVDNPTLNAFAVPGGVIGVHTGLIMEADTEGQLASVLAHELAHLSQRHFARRVEAQKNSALPNMAGLLAGLVLAATTGSDAGIAAITASQAASLQNQLRFSRQNEQEADRIGMQTMVRAGLDPNAAANMFVEMNKLQRFAGQRPPEFLLTHPITESRISDARNRARQFPRKIYTASTDYQLMRTRVSLDFYSNSKEAVKAFEDKISSGEGYAEANQYGLVLALTKDGNFSKAYEQLTPLIKKRPNQLAYQIAKADLDINTGKLDLAINELKQLLSIAPSNHPLTMTLTDAYLKANQPHLAAQLLKEHSLTHDDDPNVWYLLAEAHGLAGDIVGVHQARAEFFILTGVLDKAHKQLGYALPLTTNNSVLTAKITERRNQILAMKNELENL